MKMPVKKFIVALILTYPLFYALPLISPKFENIYLVPTCLILSLLLMIKIKSRIINKIHFKNLALISFVIIVSLFSFSFKEPKPFIFFVFYLISYLTIHLHNYKLDADLKNTFISFFYIYVICFYLMTL